jgi:hypothetical protein
LADTKVIAFYTKSSISTRLIKRLVGFFIVQKYAWCEWSFDLVRKRTKKNEKKEKSEQDLHWFRTNQGIGMMLNPMPHK